MSAIQTAKASPNGARRKRVRALSPKVIRAEYQPVLEDPLVRRAAHFLNWVATNYPGVLVPWNWVVQGINGYARTPNQDSQQVVALRGRSSAIRIASIKDFGRTITMNTEMGAVRACVDSTDTLEYEMGKQTRKLASARRAVITIADLIDPSDIKADTPERARRLEWFKTDVGAIVKQIGAASFENRLLAPTTDDGKGGGKGK